MVLVRTSSSGYEEFFLSGVSREDIGRDMYSNLPQEYTYSIVK